MEQLLVEMEDLELNRLRAAARARQIDSAKLTKAQLKQLLALQGDHKYQTRLAVAVAKALAIHARRGMGKMIEDVPTAPASQALMDAWSQNGMVFDRNARLRLGQKRARQRAKSAVAPGEADTAAIDAAMEQAERAKRLAAVMSMHGIWKGDPTKPQDGAEYQREVRAEWR